MATTRTYDDACLIAGALDIVGERWALLIVRELLFGPRRFSDLRTALPKASTNLLSDRLRELETNGVIERRRLPPPAGSMVYELTNTGAELSVVLGALGDWAARSARPPSSTAVLTPTSILLALCSSLRPDRRRRWPTIQFTFEEGVWTAWVIDGSLRVASGEQGTPELVVHTDPWTLNRVLDDPGQIGAAQSEGRLKIQGDDTMFQQLLGVRQPRG